MRRWWEWLSIGALASTMCLSVVAGDLNKARTDLSDSDVSVRRRAVSELAGSRDPAAASLLAEALGDRESSVQVDAARGLSRLGVVDYGALGSLRRLGNDLQAEPETRIEALSAMMILQPGDTGAMRDALRLAGEVRGEGALGSLTNAFQRQGDAAVPEIAQAFNSHTISGTIAKRSLMAIRTPLAMQQLSEITNAERGHATTQPVYLPSHYQNAPEVMQPGWIRNEKKTTGTPGN